MESEVETENPIKNRHSQSDFVSIIEESQQFACIYKKVKHFRTSHDIRNKIIIEINPKSVHFVTPNERREKNYIKCR